MLVLSRLLNEGIWIGDDIHITVLRIKGTQVRLGINAPRGLAVARDELYGNGHEAQVDVTVSAECGQ